MSFFKKAMASMGVGSAKVDTILNNPKVRVGEGVNGYINIQGGSVEQKIDNVYLEVQTKYEKEQDDQKVMVTTTVQKVTINVNATILPKQNVQIPFSFILSTDTPISMGNTPIWIHTGLDIKMALDPTDKDRLEVYPHQFTQVVWDALQGLGFQLKKVKNEHYRRSNTHFMQNFEFRPTNAFRGQLDELEVAFFIHNSGVELLLEIDRKARGLGGFLAEAMNMDETKVRVNISIPELQQGPQYVAQKLHSVIQQYA